MPLAWPDPQPDPSTANTRDSDIRTVLLQEYGDHGQWARHYSTVRMTLGTFFITAATGIITLHWDTPQFALGVIAGVIFVMGVILFWVFTSLTFKKMNAQANIVNSYNEILRPRQAPVKRVKLFSPTGLPLAIVASLLFALLDFWWLYESKSPAPCVTTNVGANSAAPPPSSPVVPQDK